MTEEEIVHGIPGSPTNHHSAPYALTEEFVSVYRMHPLIRDDYSFRRAQDDKLIEQRTLDQVTDRHGNELLQGTPIQDLLYSFGTLYPGALQLHNYPRLLQHFTRPDGKVTDIGATDVLRMREFGVPRYTLFRDLLHLRPIRTFEEVTDNPQWVRQMKDVYDGRIDRLDLMIGMFAEPKPTGFGFSDTAFRIFILMASRRLKSDRFFGNDYTPEVYTPTGIEWIENTTMLDVLLRHYPGSAIGSAGYRQRLRALVRRSRLDCHPDVGFDRGRDHSRFDGFSPTAPHVDDEIRTLLRLPRHYTVARALRSSGITLLAYRSRNRRWSLPGAWNTRWLKPRSI